MGGAGGFLQVDKIIRGGRPAGAKRSLGSVAQVLARCIGCKAAISNSGQEWPVGLLTTNLSPAALLGPAASTTRRNCEKAIPRTSGKKACGTSVIPDRLFPSVTSGEWHPAGFDCRLSHDLVAVVAAYLGLSLWWIRSEVVQELQSRP
jgi:hypothetical protein